MLGQSIGRYHILEQLGRGGMATVYKAYDTRLEREVAIKIIRRDAVSGEMAGQMLKRFEREARALAKLDHPNIVKLLDYGEHEASPYLVMQYVRGGVLKITPEHPTPYTEAALILIPIARALDYAHRHAMIHRDVKPSNILLSDEGLPMLSDFGIAKILGTEGDTNLTGTGMGIGTPEYMSPEQGLGQVVDYRADIYSLGVVFYQMVTGRKPYEATTPMAVVIKHISEPLPNPRQYGRNLPEQAVRVIYKAMAKNPAERYQSMADFAAVLESLKPEAGSQAREQQGLRTIAAPQTVQPQKVKPAASTQAYPPPAHTQASSRTALEAPLPPMRINFPAQPVQTPTAPSEAEKKRPRWGLWAGGCAGIVLLVVLVVAGVILVSLLGNNGGTGVAFKTTEAPLATETLVPPSSTPMPSETLFVTSVAPTPVLSIELGDAVRVDEGGFSFQPIHGYVFEHYTGLIIMSKTDVYSKTDPIYQFDGFLLDGSKDLAQVYAEMKAQLGNGWDVGTPRSMMVDGKPGLASDVIYTNTDLKEHTGIFVVVRVSDTQGFRYMSLALTEDWNKEISEVSAVVLNAVHFFDIVPLPSPTALSETHTPTPLTTWTPRATSYQPTPTQSPAKKTRTPFAPTAAPTAVPTAIPTSTPAPITRSTSSLRGDA